ncbi:MAG: caspase family protein [Saprospiraceae bacterium]|nr:caspase family protein [Saprospiraceae bacterium]
MKTYHYTLLFFLLAISFAFSLPVPRSEENPPEREGKDYAVFFYVTKFQPGWQGLPDTKTEVEALSKELRDNYGFIEPELVPNPTKQQIYDKIAAWNERLGPDDQVLFFFSMHGYYDPASELGYLIAADGISKDRYYKTWLDYNSLRPYFAQCKAKHVLVALDACYSGSFGNIEKSPDYPAYDEDLDCESQIATSFDYRVRQYVCAGSREAKTPGKSLFAAKMLETLRRGATNADGILRFEDLTYALGKIRTPEPVHGAFSGHEPGGQFVFVHKNACAPKPDRDGDDVPDGVDKCPDTWGSRADGCPQEIRADNTALDLQAWKNARQLNTEPAYRDYLRQFPNGEFKDAANVALRRIEGEAIRRREDIAWEVALEKNTPATYKKYLADYPAGLYRDEADTKIKALELADNREVVRNKPTQNGGIENNSEKPVSSVTAPVVIENYLKAIGGKEALKRVNDMKMSMTASAEGQIFDLVIQRKMPNKVVMTMLVSGFVLSQTKFDGEKGVVMDMNGEVQALNEVSLKTFKEQSGIFEEIEYATNGTKLQLKGVEKVEGRDAYKLEITTPFGTKITDFFDKATWLKIRSVEIEQGDEGPVTSTTDYEDYRTVSGIKVPYTMKMSGSTPIPMAFKVQLVDINKGIPNSEFYID